MVVRRKEVQRVEYIKPEAIIVDLTEDEALVAMARCPGGAYTAGNCS